MSGRSETSYCFTESRYHIRAERHQEVGNLETNKPQSWQTLKESLRRSAVLVFLAAELVLTIVCVIYYATGRVTAARFLANICIYTGAILALVFCLYHYAKKVWFRAYVSQMNLLSIWHITTDAVFTVEADSMICEWSRGAERIFGYSAEEARGLDFAALFPSPDALSYRMIIRTLDHNEPVERLRALFKKKNGELFTAEISASLILLPDTIETGALVVLRDVSKQLEMEEKARESEVRFRNLFESSLDGIVTFDGEGRILDCNQAYADMLGYTREELERMTITELTPLSWHTVDEDIVENQLLKAGRTDEYTKDLIRKDGTVLPVAVRAWQVIGREGDAPGYCATVKDVSERQKYEGFIRETIIRLEEANERLRDLDRLKLEFVAVVTHELRSPLGTIQSSLSALRSITPRETSPEFHDLMDILERGVHRLSQLIEDLLDITHIESDQLSLNPETVDAAELAGFVFEMFEPGFLEKGLGFSLETPEERCFAECDPGRIEQVLVNLLENALKFTSEGGVTLRVECTATRVVYSVADTGPGIPPEHHQKIFEKFATLDMLQEDTEPSMGLGLAISKGIVETSGGNIWVESRVGAGSTFSFDLPRVTELPKPSPED